MTTIARAETEGLGGAEPLGGALAVGEGALAEVIALLRARVGVDLRGYRRATLARRIATRAISAGAPDVAAYVALLRADDRGEAARLLERMTVKVSRFWRNGAAARSVARALGAELARAPRPLRAWSAGCGRGEEAYTIAILLAELGQAGGPPSVLATDIDPAALAAAAAGRYPEAALAELPAALRDRWIRRDARSAAEPWTVAASLLAAVELLHHDVARSGGPPGGRAFDLVSCRNTLIYFERELQDRAFRVLCDALLPGGLLWLGEAEWPSGEAAERLETVDRAARLFRLRGGRPDA
jgi:chemotaxis protein methyltransferase CheR